MVPIPTLPLSLMTNKVDVATLSEEEDTMKRGWDEEACTLAMENVAHGDVVPIPRCIPSKIKFELLANPEPSKYSTPPVTPPVVVPVPPFAMGSAKPLYETDNVPSDVMGEPEIERKEGTDIFTDLTLPLPPAITMAPPPVAEIIGFCGVPVIEMFVPAVIDLIMFDANTRPDPRLISVLLVLIPPNICRRPFDIKDP